MVLLAACGTSLQEPFSQIQVLQAPFPWFGHGRRYSPHGNCPTAANQGYFSEACLLLYHWFPPSQPSLQGNTVAAALTSGSASPSPCSPRLQARPLSLLECSWGLPAWSGPPWPFCPILLSQTLQPSDGGEGASSLWCCRPLWSDRREGVSSLWCCRPPFGQLVGRGLFSLVARPPLVSLLGCPHWHPLPLHRILPGLLVHKQMP